MKVGGQICELQCAACPEVPPTCPDPVCDDRDLIILLLSALCGSLVIVLAVAVCAGCSRHRVAFEVEARQQALAVRP